MPNLPAYHKNNIFSAKFLSNTYGMFIHIIGVQFNKA